MSRVHPSCIFAARDATIRSSRARSRIRSNTRVAGLGSFQEPLTALSAAVSLTTPPDAAGIEPRINQDRGPNGNVMIGGHCLCASSHVPELIRSRHLAKELKEAVVEIVDDDARSVTRYEICRHRPAYGDGWSSTGRGLEHDQAERIGACGYQQKVDGSIHRDEIVTVFVADKIGVHARNSRPLGSIANNNQPTAEAVDRVGVIQDLGEMFLSCDSANEPEHNRLSVLIA